MDSGTKTDLSSGHALVGSVINGYRLTRLIGRGGMGSVFAAELALHDSSSGAATQVAVKVLHERLAAVDPTAVDRFINEARSTARMNHPGLVKIFDFGYTESGSVYIMMEFLSGELLRERLRKRAPLPLQESCRIGQQVAAALSAAHDTGIVHRDLKPENIMILPERAGEGQGADVSGGERIKVLDFGLAKIIAAAAQETMPGYKTATGAILGTPTYMSPEQCRANGGKIDDRSDVYSLAVVLFEMLSGRPPFKANAPGELIAMHIIEPAPSIDAFVKDVPQVLQELFARTLSKSPDERPSMREVLGVLSGLAEGAPTVAVPAVQTIEVPQAPGPRPSLRKAAVTASPSSSSEAAPREPRRSFPIAALLSAGVLLACIGAFAAWHLSTRGEAGARTASGVPLSPPRPAPSAPPAVAERSAGAAAPPSTPPPAPVPAPAAAALPATPEPALPAPPLRRAAGDRRRNKPGPPRSSESGGSHELNVTPVF